MAGALLLMAAAACASTPHAAAPASPTPSAQRLLFTYYYYWYDVTSGAHMQPSILRDHLPDNPAPSWRSEAWQEKQLSDMSDAGIDGALAVYWGFDRPQDDWSYKGLTVMADAYYSLAQHGKHPPHIGMFFDTSSVDMRDLTTDVGKQWFYANFRDFFTRIPRDQWQLVNGSPVAFLFTSDSTRAFDQSTFDYVDDHFLADFGVRPYIVREVSWDYPFSGWAGSDRLRDYNKAIVTENSYLWAASIHGYVDRGGVATVGPGFDDHLVPGRGAGTIVDRQSGAFYKRAFDAAIQSKKTIIAIETWNEMHEGSDVCESTEYGRTYIGLTRIEADRFHSMH